MEATTRTAAVIVWTVLLFLTACAGPISSESSENKFDLFAAELPPCRLAPLSEGEVLAIAHDVLGETFQPKDLPEPQRRVREYRCVYIYEQSTLYFNGAPASIDAADAALRLWIARDRTFMQ